MRTPAAAPASPQRRLVGAVGAILLLAGLIVGLPLALIFLAGDPLPADAPTGEAIRAALTSPDDGTLFLGVLAVIGWLAWASFTLSVLLEAYARLTRRPAPTVPGLRTQQRIAAGLIAAIAAIVVSPTLASADAALVEAPPVNVTLSAATKPVASAVPEHPPESGAHAAADTAVHVVQRGEALLDLQDRYGISWQRIARANYGVEQPDGNSLQPGQTRIYAGWQLRIPASAPGTGALATPAEQQVYEVAKGDWMWHVADRYLGDPQRYPEIATLNPELTDRHGDFPDHIEPGWDLRLPDDAVDRGPIPHATGTAAVEGAAPAQAPSAQEPAAEDEPTPDAPAELPEEPPTPMPTAVAEPTIEVPAIAPAAEAPTTDGQGEPGTVDTDLEQLAPAALIGAGLLAALVVGAAAYQRSRRHPYHRPGFRFTSPTARRLERTLRSAQQPVDTARLGAALGSLAAGLAGRTAPLPDVVGALVDDGAVHLLLTSPCADPPAPWQEHGDRWTLLAGAELPPEGGGLAPVPTLAAVGSQAGIHLLLDLERLGFVTVYGDPARATDLLRYLAAELACNSWSNQVEVLLAGFDPVEAELLMALNPNRVRVLDSIADGLTLLRQRISSVQTALRHTGAGDALAGRVGGVAGDAWMPQVLLAATPSDADLEAITALGRELDHTRRCAVAVAVTCRTPGRTGQRRVTVTPDGTVHLRLPWVRASLSTASLTPDELTQLADAMRAARTAPPAPVPPAAEIEPWAAGTDAAGSLLTVPRPAGSAEGVVDEADTLGPSIGGGHYFFPPDVRLTDDDADRTWSPPATQRPADPGLDADLSAWYADDIGRPRISILGPVNIDGPGVAPEHRRRLHVELIVFLAQRGARGADSALIASALWPDTTVTDTTVQLLISRARRWLGTDPGGAAWLADIDVNLRYRLLEGYLFDWHLFRRLRARGEVLGDEGAGYLRAALQLVRGAPLDNADRTRNPGTRNPYPWLSGSTIHPDHVVATVVDASHQLADLCLKAGDSDGARWAVQQAWLTDVERTYDQPWRDLMRAEYAAGQSEELRKLVTELMDLRDADAPEDLAPDTYDLIRRWSGFANAG